MTEPLEDASIVERLLRISERAHGEACRAAAAADAHPEKDPTAADPSDRVAALPMPDIRNLCRDIDVLDVPTDAEACADAILAGHLVPSRTLAAFRRARMEASCEDAWALEVREGETMIGTMTRVISEGMPSKAPPTPVGIVCGPGLEQMRAEFDALPSAERADEIERHLWAMKDAARVRTRFSSLLLAIGIG